MKELADTARDAAAEQLARAENVTRSLGSAETAQTDAQRAIGTAQTDITTAKRHLATINSTMDSAKKVTGLLV